MPQPRHFFRLISSSSSFSKKGPNVEDQNNDDNLESYARVMKALVWRYIVRVHEEESRLNPDNNATEDDVNSLRSDMQSWRSELMDLLKIKVDNPKNNNNEDCLQNTSKKMRVWERRLVRDFNVTYSPAELNQQLDKQEPVRDRWKRVARQALVKSSKSRSQWSQVIDELAKRSQIGRSTFNADQGSCNLKVVMDQAQKLRTMREGENKDGEKSCAAVTPIRLLNDLPQQHETVLNLLMEDHLQHDYNPKVRNSFFLSSSREDKL